MGMYSKAHIYVRGCHRTFWKYLGMMIHMCGSDYLQIMGNCMLEDSVLLYHLQMSMKILGKIVHIYEEQGQRMFH